MGSSPSRGVSAGGVTGMPGASGAAGAESEEVIGQRNKTASYPNRAGPKQIYRKKPGAFAVPPDLP
ncbi:hypothetical protein GCM10028822_31300 [Hymenobacter terrigena]